MSRISSRAQQSNNRTWVASPNFWMSTMRPASVVLEADQRDQNAELWPGLENHRWNNTGAGLEATASHKSDRVLPKSDAKGGLLPASCRVKRRKDRAVPQALWL